MLRLKTLMVKLTWSTRLVSKSYRLWLQTLVLVPPWEAKLSVRLPMINSTNSKALLPSQEAKTLSHSTTTASFSEALLSRTLNGSMVSLFTRVTILRSWRTLANQELSSQSLKSKLTGRLSSSSSYRSSSASLVLPSIRCGPSRLDSSVTLTWHFKLMMLTHKISGKTSSQTVWLDSALGSCFSQTSSLFL